MLVEDFGIDCASRQVNTSSQKRCTGIGLRLGSEQSKNPSNTHRDFSLLASTPTLRRKTKLVTPLGTKHSCRPLDKYTQQHNECITNHQTDSQHMRSTIKSRHRYTNKHYHAKERSNDGQDIKSRSKTTKMQCLGEESL